MVTTFPAFRGQGQEIQHIVCRCNTAWSSILPAEPCQWHPNLGANTEMTLRFDFHPCEEYVGKHRAPEK